MKSLFLFLCALCSTTIIAQEKLSISELESAFNCTWEGSLTYKNYADGRMITLPTTLQLRKKNTTTISYTQEYPNEPKANSNGNWKLKEGGTIFNGGVIIEKTRKDDGSLEFTIQFEGKDNGKESTMYITYRLSETKLSYIKEVQYLGSEERFVRNRYEYTKKQ